MITRTDPVIPRSQRALRAVADSLTYSDSESVGFGLFVRKDGLKKVILFLNLQLKNLEYSKILRIFADRYKTNIMQINTMNESQMMILEAFAGAQDEQELNALMDVLRNFYALRLEKEMERLWDNGTLDQPALDKLRGEHLRTPYHK